LLLISTGKNLRLIVDGNFDAMKIFGLTTSRLELASRSLDLVVDSTSKVASNIANITTPGYKAVETKDFNATLADSLKNASNGGLVRTNPKHFSLSDINNNRPFMASDEPEKIDGNNVNIDKEALKMTENKVNNTLFTTIAGKEIGSMRRAIGLSAQ
jgi:flagellar basal-body rod protein FlgB